MLFAIGLRPVILKTVHDPFAPCFRVENAIADIRKTYPSVDIKVFPLDLMSGKSIRAAAADINGLKLPIHVRLTHLILSAQAHFHGCYRPSSTTQRSRNSLHSPAQRKASKHKSVLITLDISCSHPSFTLRSSPLNLLHGLLEWLQSLHSQLNWVDPWTSTTCNLPSTQRTMTGRGVMD